MFYYGAKMIYYHFCVIISLPLFVPQGRVKEMGEAQWYISWDEFKELPPSLKYLSLKEEIDNRKTGTEFINKLGHSLGL